jgi:hypothetical protein
MVFNCFVRYTVRKFVVLVDQPINSDSKIRPCGLLRVSIKVDTFTDGLCELLSISLVQTIKKRKMSVLSIWQLLGFQRIITLGITMLIIVTCYSQDIESFKDATPVKISDGLSANTMLTSKTITISETLSFGNFKAISISISLE